MSDAHMSLLGREVIRSELEATREAYHTLTPLAAPGLVAVALAVS